LIETVIASDETVIASGENWMFEAKFQLFGMDFVLLVDY
jgi:hypothetical protein